MSLRGVIKGIDSESGDSGQFDLAITKFKDAIKKLSGFDFSNNSDSPQGTIEGIVQGDIKLTANNNWNSTLYYGFTDAAGKVGFEGTQASSLIKLSNTVMSAAGYTLGGTGPASKKMYQGSNLSGFTVQFKWYTPMMTGWREAIQALSLLAWPTATRALDKNQTPKKEGSEVPQNDNDVAAIIEQLKQKLNQHSIEASNLCRLLSNIPEADQNLTENEFIAKYKFNPKICDMNEIYYQYAQSTDKAGLTADYLKGKGAAFDVIAKDKTNLNALSGQFQFELGDIGQCNTDDPYRNNPSEVTRNPKASLLDGGKIKTVDGTPKKDPNFNAGALDALGAAMDIFGGIGNLLGGMMDSIAVNPPKVELCIYSGDTLKYRLTPLVITSFTVNTSRETIEGDPVIVTIDLTFDYYIVNATGAEHAPDQLFAGSPIFRASNTPVGN